LPGISLVYDRKGKLAEKENKIINSFSSLNQNGSLQHDISLINEHLIIGYTFHEKYPVAIFSDDECIYYIDGQIFGKNIETIKSELSILAKTTFSNPKTSERIAQWISDTDGEYAVLIFNKKKNEVLVFNDYLSRLPLYYYNDDDNLIVSRNLWFILNITGKKYFDREAISQYLTFGYPLGAKTIFLDIYQLGAASKIWAGPDRPWITIENLLTFNFDEKFSKKLSLRDHAENITELLCEATKHRADASDKNVLALSGGLDSRTVAVCLKNMQIPFSCITFLDYYGIVAPDIKYAIQIAESLKIKQELIRLERAKGEDVLELIKIKCGTNYLGVSFSIPLIKKIKEVFGERITLFTGDGGDRVLRDTTPARLLKNIKALAKYIIDYNHMVPPHIVSKITNIDENSLFSSLENHLTTYPENSMNGKYLHFIFYERCPKWHFQGEDRNRFYTRHVTPFYSINLFKYCMKIPNEYKKGFKLYREVLTKLSPSVAAINNSEWGFAITSRKLPLYCLLRKFYFLMSPKIREIIQKRQIYKKKIDIYSNETNIMQCFFKQLENCDALYNYMSKKGIVENVCYIDKMGFDHLFTLVSLVEKIKCHSSTIEDYMKSDLI